MQLIKRSLAGLSLLGLAVMPFTAAAISYGQTNTSSTSDSSNQQNRTGSELNFCSRINATSSDLNSKLSKLGDDRGKVRTEMLNNLSDRKTKRAGEVKQIRDKARSEFLSHVDQIGQKATTDAQKQAVADFKTAVTTAFNTRNAAIDAAVASYQTAAQSTITDRENKVKTAATTFQAAVTAAIAQAKTDCANNVAPATARQTMYNSIKNANDAFRAVVQALPDGTLINLAHLRDAAIQAANKTFKDAVKTARDALKAAFPSA